MSFAHVLTLLSPEVNLPFSITPLLKLDKARDTEIQVIKEQLRDAPQIYEFETVLLEPGRFEFKPAPSDRWGYHVIRFDGHLDLADFALALQLIDPTVEIGLVVTDIRGGCRCIRTYRNIPSFFEEFGSRLAEGIGSKALSKVSRYLDEILNPARANVLRPLKNFAALRTLTRRSDM